jgi:type II secretion system protein N
MTDSTDTSQPETPSDLHENLEPLSLTDTIEAPRSEADEKTSETAQSSDSALKRLSPILKNLGWFLFGILSFLVFTLSKLPEDRAKAYLLGLANSQLASKGATLSAESGRFSIGFGISYILKDVKINAAGIEKPFSIPELKVKPALLGLIFGKVGGSVKALSNGTLGEGSLEFDFSVKNSSFSANLNADNFDAGQTGVLYLGTQIRGSATLSGQARMNGDFTTPSSLEGQAKLDLKKIRLDPQTMQGFQIPTINLQEGKIVLETEQAKLFVRTLSLGKPGSSDDIVASGNGEVNLGRTWETSPVNLKLNFKFSENLTKSFVFLDALLGAGKRPDGSYAYQLSGPLLSPQFLPQP